MSDYLISTEPGEHHRLEIVHFHAEINPLIYIHTNHRTIGLSLSMARELRNGLSAILDGPFDRAISELALQMELDEKARRSSAALAAPQAVPSRLPLLKPELDQL